MTTNSRSQARSAPRRDLLLLDARTWLVLALVASTFAIYTLWLETLR